MRIEKQSFPFIDSIVAFFTNSTSKKSEDGDLFGNGNDYDIYSSAANESLSYFDIYTSSRFQIVSSDEMPSVSPRSSMSPAPADISAGSSDDRVQLPPPSEGHRHRTPTLSRTVSPSPTMVATLPVERMSNNLVTPESDPAPPPDPPLHSDMRSRMRYAGRNPLVRSSVPEPNIRYFGTQRITMNTGRVVTKSAGGSGGGGGGTADDMEAGGGATHEEAKKADSTLYNLSPTQLDF